MRDVGRAVEVEREPARDAPTASAPPVAASPAAQRDRVAGELWFRASGGRAGTPPFRAISAERQAAAGDLAHRVRVMRQAEGDAPGPDEDEQADAAVQPVRLPVSVDGESHTLVGDPELGRAEIHTTPQPLTDFITGLMTKYAAAKPDGLDELLPKAQEADALLQRIAELKALPQNTGRERLAKISRVFTLLTDIRSFLLARLRSEEQSAELALVRDAAARNARELVERLLAKNGAELDGIVTNLSPEEMKTVDDVLLIHPDSNLKHKFHASRVRVNAQDLLKHLPILRNAAKVIREVARMDPKIFTVPKSGAPAPAPTAPPPPSGVEVSCSGIVSAVKALKGSWGTLDERRAKLGAAVNAALGPSIASVDLDAEDVADCAQFLPKDWKIAVRKGELGAPSEPGEEALAELADSLSHEARHAEQWHRMLMQEMFTGLTEGADLGKIKQRESLGKLAIKESVVNDAFTRAQPIIAALGGKRDSSLDDPEAEKWRTAVCDHDEEMNKVRTAMAGVTLAAMALPVYRSEKAELRLPPEGDDAISYSEMIDLHAAPVRKVYEAMPHEADAFAVGKIAKEGFAKP